MKLIFIKQKFKIFTLKIFKKLLKTLFKKYFPLFIHKILMSIEYKDFFEERRNFDSVFVPFHSDVDWIISELNQNGFCKINHFWSEDQCINVINDIEGLLINYPKYVHSENKSDLRLYGAENISSNINIFSKNDLLNSVANKYNQKNTQLGFTLAAKMPYQKNSNGSGEGWHRDAFFRQFKAILYLSDVGINNGPFEIIKNSNKYKNLLEDIQMGNLKYMQFRLSEKEIFKIISKEPQRKKTILGKMGTLILVDTSCLHRGSPILSGIRYSITNYYYTLNQIDNELFKKFNVLPKEIHKKIIYDKK